MEKVWEFLLFFLAAGLVLFGSYLYEALPRARRERIERQPWRGSYPRGNSLWARFNRPIGWREN